MFCVVCKKNQLESHDMIFDLKSPSNTDGAISCGINLQTFGPKWDRFSVPLYTEWTFCIVMQVASQYHKQRFTDVGETEI